MTTRAQAAENFKQLLESGKIKPASAPVPTAYPVPPAQPEMNPLLRGPMPSTSVLVPDTARQWHHSSIPQTRILPMSPIANPVAGAQAQSQAIVQIANTPTTSSGGG